MAAERGASLFWAAARNALAERGRFLVALSGGSSPAVLFRRLAAETAARMLDWSLVHVFWVDERCVPPDHAASNYNLAHGLFLSRLPGPGPVIHRISGELSAEVAAACYERDLSETFGPATLPVFDLVLLGMGSDGHTASLFPEEDLTVQPWQRVAVVHVPRLETDRVTLTLPVLNAARQVLFFVTGGDKAAMVGRIFSGQGSSYPAAKVIPAAGHVTWFLDREAAAGLLESSMMEGERTP